MSHWIEYQAASFMIPAGMRGLRATRYVIAMEGGSNNLTERSRSGRERAVRDWYIAMIGSADQVLRQAVKVAGDCEGMSLHLCGRRTTPEAYIRRVRRLLDSARDDAQEHITLCATVSRDHALIGRCRQFGMAEEQFTLYGQDLTRLRPPEGEDGADWGLFFRAVEPCLHDGTVQPGRLGEVWGMPAS